MNEKTAIVIIVIAAIALFAADLLMSHEIDAGILNGILRYSSYTTLVYGSLSLSMTGKEITYTT